jgi:hypothetical protein
MEQSEIFRAQNQPRSMDSISASQHNNQSEGKKEDGFWSRIFGGGKKNAEVQSHDQVIREQQHTGLLEPKLKTSNYKRASQIEMDELFVIDPGSAIQVTKNLYPRRRPLGMAYQNSETIVTVGADQTRNPGIKQEDLRFQYNNPGDSNMNYSNETPANLNPDHLMPNRLNKPATNRQMQKRSTTNEEGGLFDDWDDRLNYGVLDEDLHFLEDPENQSCIVEFPMSQGLAGLQRKQSELPFVFNDQFKREFSKNIDQFGKEGNFSKSFGRQFEMISKQKVAETNKLTPSQLLSPPIRSTAIKESSVSKETSSASKTKFEFGTFGSEISMDVPPEINNFTVHRDNRVIGENQFSLQTPSGIPAYGMKPPRSGVPVPIKYSHLRAGEFQ